jgi:hypothetical protein
MTTSHAELAHLEWAVKSRARNLSSALRLLRLFEEHEKKWKTKTVSRAAQELIAVVFSLWRAAFLADKTSKREAVFAHGKAFLKRMIEDNAISYLQDKSSREWTFNYYTRNARYSLQFLAQKWTGIVPAFQDKKRTPTERWDYCQDVLDEALTNFEAWLAKQK